MEDITEMETYAAPKPDLGSPRMRLRSWAALDRLERLSDGLAAAVAVSLPWSTSATGILLGLWLITLIPLLDFDSVTARGDVARGRSARGVVGAGRQSGCFGRA